ETRSCSWEVAPDLERLHAGCGRAMLRRRDTLEIRNRSEGGTDERPFVSREATVTFGEKLRCAPREGQGMHPFLAVVLTRDGALRPARDSPEPGRARRERRTRQIRSRSLTASIAGCNSSATD